MRCCSEMIMLSYVLHDTNQHTSILIISYIIQITLIAGGTGAANKQLLTFTMLYIGFTYNIFIKTHRKHFTHIYQKKLILLLIIGYPIDM